MQFSTIGEREREREEGGRRKYLQSVDVSKCVKFFWVLLSFG